jgi:hypothetical protein
MCLLRRNHNTPYPPLVKSVFAGNDFSLGRKVCLKYESDSS